MRFVHDIFCKMQPGVVLSCLHGKQQQNKRNIVYKTFCGSKSAVLFCTDIAARGLDFPAVDWVVQVDCPEDTQTYIHRVGRTARFDAQGRALLMLLPSEQPMVDLLVGKRVPVEKLAINPAKLVSIRPQLSSFLAQSPELKYLAEKALICYTRSVFLQSNKAVFDVRKLPVPEFAQSLGLLGAPKMKFLKVCAGGGGCQFSPHQKQHEKKNQNYAVSNDSLHAASGIDAEDLEAESGVEIPVELFDEKMPVETFDEKVSEDEDGALNKKPRASRLDRLFSKQNQTILSSHYQKHKDSADASDDDATPTLFKLTRKDHTLPDDTPITHPLQDPLSLSVRDRRKLKRTHQMLETAQAPVKHVFDDDGKARLAWQLETETEFMAPDEDLVEKRKQYVASIQEKMQDADVEDRRAHRDRLRAKKFKKSQAAKVETTDAPVLLNRREGSDSGVDISETVDDFGFQSDILDE